MLSPSEESYLKENAYIPEHLFEYVIAISESEPILIEDYLCYHKGRHLIFIGYPLTRPFVKDEMKDSRDKAIKRFDSLYVALIAPEIDIQLERCHKKGSDYYYSLNIFDLKIQKKLKNMIRRGSRELQVDIGRDIREEHRRLVTEFMTSRDLDEDTKYILRRIPEYVSSVLTSMVFSARDREGRLIAFDIADFGSKEYAFYMFNFTSKEQYIPGASDLLFYEIVKASRDYGKRFINMGLGINEGVRFFKRKWGAVPFLRYEFCLYDVRKRERWEY